MKQPSQQDLLGYVLGALDAQEHEQVQQSIDNDPTLEEQLLDLKNSVLPLELIDDPCGPPAGLARRTCEFVANFDNMTPGIRQNFDQTSLDPVSLATGTAGGDSAESDRIRNTQLISGPNTEKNTVLTAAEINQTQIKSVGFTSQPDLRPRLRSWSHTDFLVGIAVIAVLAGILFPAVAYTRFQSKLIACQSNLQTLGKAFLEYSSLNNGKFVEIPGSGNLAFSGVYAPILKQFGLVEDDSVVGCPGAGSETPINIPTCELIENASGKQLQHFQKIAGGQYGYSLGYAEDNRYIAPRNMGRTYVVLLADMPSANLEGRRSASHRGYGQNCLFEDGHVGFVRGHAVGTDPIYENDLGLIGPGLNDGDSVIAPSHLSPVIFEIRGLTTPIGRVD